MKRLLAQMAALVWVGLGLAALARRRRHARGDFRVYILEYHRVVAQLPPGAAGEGQVSVDLFRRHVEWLRRRFELITVADAAARLKKGIDRDYIVLTFDDGYADNAEVAFPVLRAAGVPATIYLATGFLDGRPLWFDVARRALAATTECPAIAPPLLESLLGPPWPPELEPAMRRLKDAPDAERLMAIATLAPLAAGRPAARPMSWDQARELHAAGIELGAHTVEHPILARLEPVEQRAEIAGSFARLEEELGPGARTFAMPNGGARDYDRFTLEILAELNVPAACTTRRGSNKPGDDLHQLRRLGVGEDSLTLLAARLAGLFDEGLRRRLGLA